MQSFDYFATCPKGLEYLLVDELLALGVTSAGAASAGVRFTGGRALGYRACLWSRLASRILEPIAEFTVHHRDDLYAGAASVRWLEHLDPSGSLAIDAVGQLPGLEHSRYVAQVVKDAIVDQCRHQAGQRPHIDPQQPQFRLHVLLRRQRAVLSMDWAGSALFHRGYRKGAGEAPLAENLAAAVLIRAGWPAIYAAGGDLCDPLCGSGTLVIEAAQMAADMAPGLARQYFGFLGWRGFDPGLWANLKTEAEERAQQGLQRLRKAFWGSDGNAAVIGAAKANAQSAGFAAHATFTHRTLGDSAPPPSVLVAGLVVTNPPYGERMGEVTALKPLYAELGAVLKSRFQGWRAGVLTAHDELAQEMGVWADHRYALWNGPLACTLWCFDVRPPQQKSPPKPLSEGATAFQNRLVKNLRHLKSWLRKEGVTCYRMYDADLPEYAAAIDWYEGYVHIQEYKPPASVPLDKAQRRLREMVRVVEAVTGVARERIAVKQRQPQRRGARYQKVAERGEFFVVHEGAAKVWVNLWDYLDTGLFLDHRPLRLRIGQQARGKRFLNLFCYTGVASVHAALGGASSTTSVDLSANYLEWAQRNFEVNGLHGAEHRLVQADVMAWLAAETQRYDLIYVDPPTFSNSKRAEDFVVQRDHARLLRLCAARLAPGGLILFSNNFRQFRLEPEAIEGLRFTDVTASTIPLDFKRSGQVHRCFEVRAQPD